MRRRTWSSRVALAAGVSLLCLLTPARAQDSEEDLFAYAMGGEVEEVRRLLDAGVNPNAADEDGETVLMFAVSSSIPEVVEMLLGAGANVYSKSSSGSTALMATVIGDGEMDDEEMRPDYLKIARLLIEAGANVGARDEEGKTALDQARDYRLVEMVRLLEEAAE